MDTIYQGTWGNYYEGRAAASCITDSCVHCLHRSTTCLQAHPTPSQRVAIYRLQRQFALVA